MQTRGQITAFAIIAILLLLSGAAILYFDVLSYKLAREQITYPPGTEGLAEFMSQCIEDSADEAVRLLGQQGGYVELPPSVANELGSFLPLDRLNLAKVPFWYFEGFTRVPRMQFMEEDISRYVKKESVLCFNEFRDFEKLFDVVPQAEMEVVTEFGQDDVFVQVLYPLKVTQKANRIVYDLDKFNAVVEARVKVAYELAVDIMNFENAFHPLENLTIDFISMDPEVPISGMWFSCGGKTWSEAKVGSRLQYVLSQNLQNIRIDNTDYPPFIAPDRTYETLERAKERMAAELNDAESDFPIEDTRAYPTLTPDDAYEYFNMFYDVGAADEDLKVRFQYDPSYGMMFDANPSNNGIMRSSNQRAPGLMGFLCIDQYHFTYDIQYPVLVTINDPESYDGRGYQFSFAFPVMVDNNRPSRIGRFDDSLNSPIYDTEFCLKGGDFEYEFRALGYDAYGVKTMSGLADVNITYQCARRVCDLGKTRAEGGAYRLITRIPAGCHNPFIKASKDGYLSGIAVLDDERDSKLYVDMTKLKTLKLEADKRDYYGSAREWGDPEELHEDDVVLVNFKIKGQEHDQFVIIPSEKQTVELIDGDGEYEIQAMLLRRDSLLGGYQTNSLKVTNDMLSGSETFKLHVFSYQPPPFENADEMMAYLIGENYPRLTPTIT